MTFPSYFNIFKRIYYQLVAWVLSKCYICCSNIYIQQLYSILKLCIRKCIQPTFENIQKTSPFPYNISQCI